MSGTVIEFTQHWDPCCDMQLEPTPMHLPRPDADGELYPVLVATLPGGEEFTWLLITSFDGRCFWAWSVDRERFETIVVNPGFGAPA